MLISKKQKIEEHIIESLAQNQYLQGDKLLKILRSKRPKTTKQAMYSALKKMMNEDIIFKVNQKYYINNLWVEKLISLFNTGESYDDLFLKLADNESITYKFPNLLLLDDFWAHVFIFFVKKLPHYIPIFVWNPHEWIIIAKKDEEEEIFRLLEKYNKKAFYHIGGNTPLDQQFKNNYSSESLRINVNSPFSFKNNYYVNIFGDYIFEVYLDKKLADEIEEYYQKNITQTQQNELKEIITQKYRARVKITKNKEKAYMLRKKLSKDFFIPKDIQI